MVSGLHAYHLLQWQEPRRIGNWQGGWKRKDKELDQWISHAIFEVVSRAGVPTSRIMTMSWVLVWQNVEEDGQSTVEAKARLVVTGFTDPDLTTLRAEAPSLSKARHMLLQLGASMKITFHVCDVKTALLQGDNSEKCRHVYLEPIAEFRQRFKMTEQQVLKLMAYAYGLRTAPRNLYQRVKRDLQGLGWKVYSLDNCAFLLYHTEELIGLCGFYVDDFPIAGSDSNPIWQDAKNK